MLLSDGIQTTGNGLNEVPELIAAGVPIDVWPIEPVTGPEVRISGMSVPRSVRVGEEYDVQVGVELVERPGVPSLSSIDGSAMVQVPIPATVRLWESLAPSYQQEGAGPERLLAEQQIDLAPGHNRLSFPALATGASGVVRLRAEITGVSDEDTFVRNNEGVATTVVALQPRVLLVEGQEGNASELSAALWRTHIESEVIAATDLPPRLSDLGWYDGMVLLDVSAHDLSLDQMSSVREFVRSEGRGLLVTGGLNAYSLGGYQNTPLESVLPIQVDPPPRTQRADVALLLIIDRSASMSIPIEVSKLDMAKEAAILSTEMLQSEDRIGVLAFDTGQSWTVPFQQVGQGLTLKQIQDTIVMLSIGGGTDIYEALSMGLTELMHQQASVRHAVILTDGRSFTDDRTAYRSVVEMARNADITLSTIAIGMDSDTELLNELAQLGSGRYYFADQPEDIPRLTLQESEIARADPVIEGDFYAELSAPHPLLHGFAPSEMPYLNGYVATTRKEQAEVVLQAPVTESNQQDPLLATWQYGLGRVVAWTPSVAGPWANAWVEWGNYGPFWDQVIRYLLPEPDSGSLQIQFEPRPEGFAWW
ncbi:MAG: VWA domain-containing protein [Chloroflexaceae bacterium]|nr:VWA domain-containing protein [Chloroflexaceae bacterium]